MPKTTDRRTYNTKISVLEKEYDVDFGVNPNMKLGDFFKLKGYKAIADMMEK